MVKRKSFLRERKGAVLLEFVLCFPILLVLFFFAIQLLKMLRAFLRSIAKGTT